MTLEGELRLYGREEILDAFLGDLNAGESYFFAGVAKDLLPLLKGHFRDFELSEDCTAYTLAPEDFCGSSETLADLTEDDAAFVDNHWAYQYPGSLEIFKHAIRSYPSSAIRLGHELVGWVVCYDAIDDLANLGSLQVLKEYRHRGLGWTLAASINTKVLGQGKTPLVHIYDSNLPSQNLSRRMGFKPNETKLFWGSARKK